MPEHLRALVVIVGIAGIAFFLARQPLTHSTLPQAEFARLRNFWFLATAFAFFSPDFWIFCGGIAVLLMFAATKVQRPLALYCALLFVFPHSLSREISGIAGINSLLELDYIGVLNLSVLLPLAIKLRFFSKSDERSTHFRLPDLLLIAYTVLAAVMYAQTYNFTGTLRSTTYLLIDIWLPYYVASRSLRTVEDFRSIAGALVLAIAIIAAIGMFETLRFWWVYESLRAPLGIQADPFYLLRGDTGLLRAQVTAGQAIAYGYAVMVGISFLPFLFANKNPFQSRLWLCGAVLTGGLVGSLSRGPWVGTAFVLFILFILKRGTSRQAIVWLNLGVLGIAVMMSPIGRIIIDFLPFVGSVDDGSVTYRQELWTASMGVIAENPWFGDLNYLENPKLEEMRQGQGIIDIVNSYLQFALTFGLVGLGLFLLIVAAAIRGAWQTRRLLVRNNDPDAELIGRCLLAAMGGILVTIATVSSIYAIPTLYWLTIGGCVAYTRHFRNQPASAKARPKLDYVYQGLRSDEPESASASRSSG